MKTINFMGQRRLAFAFSALVLVASIASLATRQLNWGLDFTGGTLVELHYSTTADLNAIRDTLRAEGYERAVVVSFGSDQDIMVRLPQGYSDEQGVAMLGLLQAAFEGEVELRRMEFVGPQVGDELREQGGLAMLLALGLVTLYIAFRFQLKFAIGAVAALAHDVIITLGFFSLTGMEFNLTVLAAVLAVIGYSINDTIVVFDRIRENFRKLRRAEPAETINVSVTETLARTLVTSLTTLMVVVALALFGGEMIFGFAVALIAGVTIGTYSSIYVASTAALAMGVTKEDLMVPVKEGADQEDLSPDRQDFAMEPMINIALRAARKAGENIVRASDELHRFEVKAKGINNFVTEVDINAEREIIYHLQKAYPDHAILGEECGLLGDGDAEYRWIIDPLDGTTNFIRGIPHYGVSIACLYRGKVEHAVVVDPVRREEFTASRGRGAQLNGHRMRVSDLASLDGALLGTGIPFRNHCDGQLEPYSKSLRVLAGQCAGIRRAGAASLDLAYVAAGRLDAFWEIGLAEWDIAAGALLVREAGGLVADIDGSDNYMASGNIVCGNPRCFKATLQVVRPLLG